MKDRIHMFAQLSVIPEKFGNTYNISWWHHWSNGN